MCDLRWTKNAVLFLRRKVIELTANIHWGKSFEAFPMRRTHCQTFNRHSILSIRQQRCFYIPLLFPLLHLSISSDQLFLSFSQSEISIILHQYILIKLEHGQFYPHILLTDVIKALRIFSTMFNNIFWMENFNASGVIYTFINKY